MGASRPYYSYSTQSQSHRLLLPCARTLFLAALALLLLASARREGGEGERESKRAWSSSSSSSTAAQAIPEPPPSLLIAKMGGAGGHNSASASEDERENPRPTAPPSQRASLDAAAGAPPLLPPPDLHTIYRHMHEGLKLKGADAEAIAALRPWYRFGAEVKSAATTTPGATTPTPTTTTGPAAPRLYRESPHFLGARCTRLVLVKLDDPAVRSVAYAVADEVMREMMMVVGPGAGDGGGNGGSGATTQHHQPDHYLAKPDELHTTVYHVSHPNSVRGCTADPNPLRTASAAVHGAERAPPSAAEAEAGAPLPPLLTQEEWEREGEAASQAVSEVSRRHPRAALVLERVLLARSGTVLLTWVEEKEAQEEEDGKTGTTPTTTAMAELRAALRREMPGASPKQPDIMHTTVLRLLGRAGDGSPALFFEDDEEGEENGGAPNDHHHRARVADLMERLTERLRGTVRVPLFDRVGRIRLASEDRFATVTHEVQLLPLGGGEGAGVATTTGAPPS